MEVYLVWTGYEDVDAVYLNPENAERWITEYIRDHPIIGGKLRTRDSFSIIRMKVLDA